MSIESRIGNKSVVHLFNEFNGLNRKGALANISKRIAVYQKNVLGMDVKVVMRNSSEMILEGFKPVTNCKGTPIENMLTNTIDGVPVYVIGEHSAHQYPDASNTLSEYEDFAKGFLQYYHGKCFGDVSIIHAHDYGMGLALKYFGENENFNIRSVFTMYDPNTFDVTVNAGMQPEDLMFNKELSGIKSGLHYADMSTVWGSAHYQHLTQGKYGRFIKQLGPSHFFNVETNWESWRESGNIPNTAIEALSAAYLEALHGKSLEFSINLKKLGITPNNILVSVTERMPKEDPRGDTIKAELEHGLGLSTDVVKTSSRGGGLTTAYTDNIGGIIHMFEHLFGPGKTYDPNGLYYALLTGGVGERLMNICLAAAGIKGEVWLGNKTLNQIMIEQAPMIAAQLPNEGKGYVVIFGNDNLMIPDGPLMVGQHLLANAKQKIFLIAQPQRVMNLREGEDVDYLKELGVMIADKETGTLREFYEKRKTDDGKFDVEFMKSRLGQPENGGDSVFKNTFYFVMSTDMAKLFHEKYSAKTNKSNGQTSFHETYGLDFSKKFIEATVIDKKTWLERYNVKDAYDRLDWEYLWDSAHDIATKAGGLGVINIGENAIWSDVGTIPELNNIYGRLISSDREERALIRGIMDIPDKNIDRSYTANVSPLLMEDGALEDQNDILISHSVFADGGKIGKNCVIINSLFEEYVEIPSNTVIIGSHLYNVNNMGSFFQNKSKLLYNVHKTSSEEFTFKNEVATASMFSHNTASGITAPVRTGEFPIFLTGKEKEINLDGNFKKDPVLNYYHYNGDMKNEPIKGIGMAVADRATKNTYSLANTSREFMALMKKIDRRLREKGIIS
jgi:NDP-sugar pyrophosphorylase family protein